MEHDMAVVLSCDNLSKTYKQGPLDVSVLRDVQLSVEGGERIAIVGTSGSGKSTLLNMLGGLDTPSEGQVHIGGKLMSALNDAGRAKLRNESLGFVYQFHHLLGEFSAVENVAMPFLIRGEKVELARDSAETLLARVGLQDRFDHKPAELSGGERQRVAIARALVTSPSCVLLDEPTGNLDSTTAQKVQELLFELNEDLGISLITVTHDMELAATMHRVLQLSDGQLHAMEL
jgi:lipoprotein-releasing system ATP-binding protein